jgi:chromosomal replication initiator protein
LIACMESLSSNGKCIIATSPELCPLIPNLRPALTSRLNAGLSVPMVLPAYSARKEILRLIAQQLQIEISDADLDSIGELLQDGITALHLKGILIRWSHQDRLNPTRTQRESKRLIDRLVDAQATRTPEPSEIAKVVGREMRVVMDQLRGPSRKSSVVRARGLAMYLMRKFTELSYQNIGEYFGGRDHTTVMHACKKTEEDLAHDHELMRIIDRVSQKLSS